MRKFLFFVALGVLAWIFVVPSCSTKFGCESAPATAHADNGNCPDDAEEAAQDARWAQSRWETIKDRPLTTGLFYDDDGVEHPFVSGEGEDADHAAAVLSQVGAPSSRAGTFPAATHVEIKAAVAMRDADERRERLTMGESVESRLTWTELGVDRPGWVVTGSFAVGAANYSATFFNADELARFLNFLFASPYKPATSRLYLHPNVVPRRSEDQLSNLRFQFDAEHGVAAAVLLVAVDDEVLRWRTEGDSARPDVLLAHDSWNQHETLFPPESFITVGELRQTVVDWGFGEQVPPTAVRWVRAEGIDWF